ncbi:MAG TPA: hypothetical protein VGG04_14190 [Candidatus Sulfotelmatobacter sp.]|jgi:hypothetical protein
MSIQRFASCRFSGSVIAIIFALSAASIAQSGHFQPNPSAGPTGVLVKSKFGGQIFGHDIDQNGTEGVLSESKSLSNGNFLASVETFDQTTGKILKVVTQTQSQDDFITIGVVGTSTGLIEHEHEVSFLNLQRVFNVINPLSGNAITGKWTPPLGKSHLLSEASRNQGGTSTAFFAQDNSGSFIPWVFSSNVAANTFGSIIKIPDSNNFGSVVPPMAYNPQTSQAVLGGGNGCFGCFPILGVANLKTGAFTEFNGAGFGFVNGIAMDAADNLIMTTTEDDASIEIYELSTDATLAVIELPNSGGLQFFSGADVEFDPINKLFLVAQPNSSSASSGSSIYVYDTAGNLQETLNGFSFSNAFNIVAAHIAINPAKRIGYVDGPSISVNELQQFAY